MFEDCSRPINMTEMVEYERDERRVVPARPAGSAP